MRCTGRSDLTAEASPWRCRHLLRQRDGCPTPSLCRPRRLFRQGEELRRMARLINEAQRPPPPPLPRLARQTDERPPQSLLIGQLLAAPQSQRISMVVTVALPRGHVNLDRDGRVADDCPLLTHSPWIEVNTKNCCFISVCSLVKDPHLG